MTRQSLAALFVLTLAFASCEKSDSTSSSSSTTAPSKSGASGAAKTKQIVYIPKNTGNPYFDPLTDGVKKACEENNVEFSTVAPDSADATSQIPLIKDQIQRGVMAITISP